ncbi:MAG: XisI protein [Okeania sp. SIO3B5]|uniref:element excision factor XisI family protein n=1 Tax=Okeania sp. SIO3B5 TaxID=2607811 RepID=UPI001401AD2E|nr:XisI protein [Okeania sp. SIO3B5]
MCGGIRLKALAFPYDAPLIAAATILRQRESAGLPTWEVKDGKIWIQQDFTEQGIAQQLLDLGVPKSDIVLAFRSPFRSPFVRQFSDFSVS